MSAIRTEQRGRDGDGVAARERALRFPDGFMWGVSTSAHQCEGDGGDQWGKFEREGRVAGGQTPGDACDWWDRAERDFDLARDLGAQSLRLSVAWARIEPRPGEFDDTALQRYRQMLEGLEQRGITPIVCLHHFAHPVWFEERGGFRVPESVPVFERFAARVVDALAPHCRSWVTFNEPNVYAIQGYQTGAFPPCRRGRADEAFRVLGNMARAHAVSYHLIHGRVPGATVSFANHFMQFVPADPESRQDRWIAGVQHRLFNLPFMEAVAHGRFPFPGGAFGGDVSVARDTWDYVGINAYGRWRLAFDWRKVPQGFAGRAAPSSPYVGDAGSPFDELYPQGIADVVREWQHLRKPFMVLENGAPDRRDRVRPWVIVQAVRTLYDVMVDEGAEILGYHHWTLTDNFEWDQGWNLRFGLVELDPETQHRRRRPSANLFEAIARENGLTNGMVAEHVPEASNEIFPASDPWATRRAG